MHKAMGLVKHLAVYMLLAVLLLACGSAQADESMRVSIPVIASGYDCSVALYDSSGQRVQLLELQDGVEGSFSVQCTGLGRHIYTALVTDRDTEDVAYDRINYRITIDLMYDSDGQLVPMVFIENLVSAESKLPRLAFVNKPTQPAVPPVPESDYTYRFYFTKVWNYGEHGNSIDWSMYNADGTKRSKKFNKEIVSEDIWRYEAFFASSAADCYVVEVPPEGYMVRYENIGEHSEVTDRCHIGGTIINSKIPQTGDDSRLFVYFSLILLAAMGLWLLSRYRGHSAKSK